MNTQLRQFEKQSGLEIFGLGAKRHIWEAALEKFAELIIAECLKKVEEEYKPVLEDKEMMKDTHWDGYVQCGVDSYVAIREHFFGVEESKGWVCPKCSADRTKIACPLGFGATVDGRCPMTVEAQ
jgi:hypothetical protein